MGFLRLLAAGRTAVLDGFFSGLTYFGSELAFMAAALLMFWQYHVVSVKQFGGITGDLAGWFLQRAELWMLAALLLSGRWLG